MLVSNLIYAAAAAVFQPQITSNIVTVQHETSRPFYTFANGSSVLFANNTHGLSSSDYGKTWTTVLTLPESYSTTPKAVIDSNYDTRAFFVYNATIYSTLDAGKTWAKTELDAPEGFSIFTVKSHPTNSSVLLATGSYYDSYYSYDVSGNYISVDKGKTYNALDIDVLPYSITTCDFRELGSPGNSTVKLLCPYHNKDLTWSGQSSDDLGEDFDSAYLYPDTGGAVKKLTSTPNYSILTVDDYEDNVNFAGPHNTSLFISDDEVSFYKPYLNLPKNFINPKVVELLGKRLLVTVEYLYDKTTDSATIPPLFFLSDSTGLKFNNISMASNLSTVGSVFTVETLPGTVFRTEKLIGSGSSNISTDNGMSWKPLKFSDKINPHNYTCNISSPNCSFVVTGIRENFITGTIFATGRESIVDPNVVDMENITQRYLPGRHFNDLQPNDRNALFDKLQKDFVAVSNDGGVTWRKLFNDTGVAYDVGSYGNIILTPNPGNESYIVQQLNYSLDQGATWQTTKLDTMLKSFYFAETNPKNISSNFTLCGVKVTNADQHSDGDINQDYHYLYNIDFSNVYGGSKCNSSTDLVKFSLNNGSSVNGAYYFSYAKNATARCSLSVEDTRWNVTNSDRCTIMDYICAPQFIQNSKGVCVPDLQYINSPEDQTSDCGTKVTPMVLIADNHCKKPLNLNPVSISC